MVCLDLEMDDATVSSLVFNLSVKADEEAVLFDQLKKMMVTCWDSINTGSYFLQILIAQE